jgi:opacity protein-like surface antigen
MRKAFAATAIMLGLGGPAIASDLYTNGAAPSALQSIAGTVATGAYVSIGAGASLASAHVPQAASDFALAGPVGDVRLGFDYRLLNTSWLVGILAGASFEDVTGDAQGHKFTKVIGYEGGVRAGRIVGGNALIYGVLLYHGQHEGLVGTNFSADRQGIEPGLGIEIDLKNGVTLGAEVDYTLYRDWQVGDARIGETELTAKVRLGFRPAAIAALN